MLRLAILVAATLAALAAPGITDPPPFTDPLTASVAAAASADVDALPHSDCFSSVLAALSATASGGEPDNHATPCARLPHARQVQVALAFLACQADFLGETDLPVCAGKALANDGSPSKQPALRACVASLPKRHYDTFQGFFRGVATTCLHFAHRDWQAHANALLARAMRASALAAASLDGVRAGLDAARAQLGGLRDEAAATREAAETVRERTLSVAAVASEAAASARLAADRNERAAAAVDELAAAERRRAAAAAQAHDEREAASAQAAAAAAAREAEVATAQAQLAADLHALGAHTAGLASAMGTMARYQAGAEALLRRVLGVRGAGAGRAFFGAAALVSAAAAAARRTRSATLPLVAGAAWLLAAERGAAASLPRLTVAAALGSARGAWWAPPLRAAEHLVSGFASGGARPAAALAALALLAWAAAAWVDPLKAARAALEEELAELRAARAALAHTPPTQPPATPARALRPRPTRRSGGG